MASSRVDQTLTEAPTGSTPLGGEVSPDALEKIDIDRSTLKSTTPAAAERSHGPDVDRTAEPSLSVFGTNVDSVRAEHPVDILGSALEAVVDAAAPASDSLAARHEELQNAGLEDAGAAGAPLSTPISNGRAFAVRNAAQQREMLQHEALLFTGPAKKKTGNKEIDDFIELHPELLPIVVKIQQELAAHQRAKDAGRSGLESKSNLDAALDRIATMLEGQPLAPQLRMGDLAAKKALAALLSGGSPEKERVSAAVVDQIQAELEARRDAVTTSGAAAGVKPLDRAVAESLVGAAERLGRLEGRRAAGSLLDKTDSERQILEAREALERQLGSNGIGSDGIRTVLTAAVSHAAERERLACAAERVYELQREAKLREHREGAAGAQTALDEYLLEQKAIFERHPEFRKLIDEHRQTAVNEAVKLLRTCREAAADIHQGAQWSFWDGGTQEERIVKALEGRTQEELRLIDQLYSEDFGRSGYASVEMLLRGEMEGPDLERALKAHRGDPSVSGAQVRALSTASLDAILPGTRSAQTIEAVLSNDNARAAAAAIDAALRSADDPTFAVIKILDHSRRNGVSPEKLQGALRALAIDPAAMLAARSQGALSTAGAVDAAGREIIGAAVDGKAASDEAVFNYLKLRAVRRSTDLGKVEGALSPLEGAQDRLRAEAEEERRGLADFYSRNPEARRALDDIAELARVQARAETVLATGIRLARDAGIRKENEHRDAPASAHAEAALAQYLAAQKDFCAAYPEFEQALGASLGEGRSAGIDLMRRVKSAAQTYKTATVDCWFWGDNDAAAGVLRDQSPEFITLFKAEFGALTSAATPASAAGDYFSGAKFDRIHALLYGDKLGAAAADAEVALSDNDRAKVTAIFQKLTTPSERAEIAEIFNPRYAGGHTYTYQEPVAGRPDHDRTVVVIAKNLDEAIEMEFKGDAQTIVKAALAGDENVMRAAEVHEALASISDPAKKGALVLDKLRTDHGEIDAQKVEGVGAAYKARYGGDLVKAFDDVGGWHWNDQAPAQTWGKAVLANDEPLASAAKLRTAVKGAGTDLELSREALSLPPLFREMAFRLQKNEGFTPEQTARASKGAGLDPELIEVILRTHAGGITPEQRAILDASDEATPEMVSLVAGVETKLPVGIRSALGRFGGGAISPSDERTVAAYGHYLKALERHREQMHAVETRYGSAFPGASLDGDLRGDLNDRDYRYAQVLIKNGATPRAYRYYDAIDGLGTDEDAITELTAGLTKEQAQRDAEEYARFIGGSSGNGDVLESSLAGDVLSDVSGDFDFDLQEQLRGAPETPAEILAGVRRRFEHEDGWFTRLSESKASGVPYLLGYFWRDSYHEMGKQLENVERAHKAGDYEQLASAAAAFDRSAGSFRAQKNVVGDTVANVGATVVVVGGTVVVIVGSGGTATPLVLGGIAAAGGAVRIGSKAAIRGLDSYGWEESTTDLGAAGVDVATLGIMSKVPVGQLVAGRVLAAGGERIAAAGAGTVLAQAGTVAEREALMALGQSSRLTRIAAGAAQGAIDGGIFAPVQTAAIGAIHEETWHNGFVDGITTLGEHGLYAVPLGISGGAVIGGGTGMFTPKALKLGRPLTPKEEGALLGARSETGVVESKLGTRAQEMLAARREANGVLTYADKLDAELMSTSLSSSQSKKVLEAARQAKMPEVEIAALEKRLGADGCLTKLDAAMVKRAANGADEVVTVIDRKTLDNHLETCGKARDRLRMDLEKPGMSEAESAAAAAKLASVERRIEALKNIEETMKRAQAAIAARKAAASESTPDKAAPLDDKSDAAIARVAEKVKGEGEAGKPLDARSEEAIADRAAEVRAARERSGSNEGSSKAEGRKALDDAADGEIAAAASNRRVSRDAANSSAAKEPAAEPQISPEMRKLNEKLSDLDHVIKAKEGYLEYEGKLLAKAERSPDGMVELNDGLRVSREAFEHGHAAGRKEVEALRVQRTDLQKQIELRETSERLAAESRSAAAERAEAMRLEAARREASAQEQRRAEAARTERKDDGASREDAARVRREAEETIRRQNEAVQEQARRAAAERTAPVERYSPPKRVESRTDIERLQELDTKIANQENFLKFSEGKLAEGGETIRFGEAEIPRTNVEESVEALRGELTALRAEREVLARVEIPGRAVEPVVKGGAIEPRHPNTQSGAADEGTGPSVHSKTPAQNREESAAGAAGPVRSESVRDAAPARQPEPLADKPRVQVLERQRNPELERLLAQVEAPKVEIVEPSPPLAQKITSTQDEIVRLEGDLVKHGSNLRHREVIEEALEQKRAVLRAFEERAAAQQRIKNEVSDLRKQAETTDDAAIRADVRRRLAEVESTMKRDDGSVDLKRVSKKMTELRDELAEARAARSDDGDGLALRDEGESSVLDRDGAPARETEEAWVNDVEEWTPSKDHREDPTPPRGDEGGGTATQTKPKVEPKTETKVDEPEAAAAVETEAPAVKPKVEEPKTETKPSTEELKKTEAPAAKPLERTEAAPAVKTEERPATRAPAAKPAESVEAAPATRTETVSKPAPLTSTRTEAAVEAQTASSPGWKLAPRSGTKALIIPKNEPVNSYKTEGAPAVTPRQLLAHEEPNTRRLHRRSGGDSGLSDESKKREELAGPKETYEFNSRPLKPHQMGKIDAQKLLKKRHLLVGESEEWQEGDAFYIKEEDR